MEEGGFSSSIAITDDVAEVGGDGSADRKNRRRSDQTRNKSPPLELALPESKYDVGG